MKKVFFLILCTLTIVCNTQAQSLTNWVQMIGKTLTLPVYSGSDTRDHRYVWIELWQLHSDKVTDALWSDLGLTVIESGILDYGDGVDVAIPYDSGFVGKIIDTNQNYIILLLEANLNNLFAKQLLVSVTKANHMVIDSVCVDATLWYHQEVPYFPMSWRLTPSMNLTTSQLVPQSAEPIYVDEHHVQFPITAQRVDTHYTITPAGRFVRTGQTHYKPKSYTATEFMNENYNTLRDGTEELLGTGEFEGPQPEVNPNLRNN